ncbi:MAG: hypothetical protein ABW128_11325 [Rhizorhabdus sp.]
MIDPQPEPRALVALRDQVGRCNQRLDRARQRVDRATAERYDATRAVVQAEQALEAWLTENPQPQIEMAL